MNVYRSILPGARVRIADGHPYVGMLATVLDAAEVEAPAPEMDEVYLRLDETPPTRDRARDLYFYKAELEDLT